MADVTQIKVSGPGLTIGKTGQKCLFHLSGASVNELEQGLTFSISGPNCKPDVITDYENLNDDGNFDAYFVPFSPGGYKITVRFNGRQVTGSPFTCKVDGEVIDPKQFLSKVAVHGRGYELGKAFAWNEFHVDCSLIKPVIGNLRVHMKGPERSSSQLNIKKNKNGIFTIQYKPTSPGVYNLTIKIADTDIPGSPFAVTVTEFLSK